MQSTDNHIERLVVDGGTLLILDAIAWRRLLFDPYVDNLSLGVRDSLYKNLAFTHYFDELVLSLQPLRSAQPSWIGLVLLRIVDRWQRVQLKRLTCPTCEWKGVTANPMGTDLYIGAADTWAALDQAAELPIKPCPHCGGTLPRHPIWIEPIG